MRDRQQPALPNTRGEVGAHHHRSAERRSRLLSFFSFPRKVLARRSRTPTSPAFMKAQKDTIFLTAVIKSHHF